MFTLIIYILILALGFMMGFLYRQTQTSLNLFQPDPRNTLKIFMGVFVLATLVIFVLSHVVTYELSNSTIPIESEEKYKNTKSIMLFLLHVFFLALVVLSNVYSLTLKKLAIVPYLLTIGFYVIFIVKDSYYIADYYTLWQKSLLVFKGDLPDFHQTGFMKCCLGSGVTLFNALMVWFGMRK